MHPVPVRSRSACECMAEAGFGFPGDHRSYCTSAAGAALVHKRILARHDYLGVADSGGPVARKSKKRKYFEVIEKHSEIIEQQPPNKKDRDNNI